MAPLGAIPGRGDLCAALRGGAVAVSRMARAISDCQMGRVAVYQGILLLSDFTRVFQTFLLEHSP